MNSEAQETISFVPLQEAAECLLNNYYQTAVVLERATLLTDPARRNRIWRCHLHAAKENVPATLIVKQVKPEGYSPSTPASWNTSRFFKDWAGAQFLNERTREAGHGPMFYGGDVEGGFILLEDMGEPTSLVEPLLKGDADVASRALFAYARRLGQMHASSFGQKECYREIQRQISPAWAAIEATSADREKEEREKQVAEFADLCARVDIEAGEAARQELAAALLSLDEPGSFTTFLHGDPCPDNIFYHDPELRLIDFEFSGFGHALRDGLYGRLPFPTCWCANAIPAEVLQQMEAIYRAELSVACPEILDEARFMEEASVVAADWAFSILRWDLEGALKQDETWGIAGTRARILSRIAMFLDTARNATRMPALCETYETLLSQLQSRWPEASPLPFYPAFQAGMVAVA